MKNTIRNICKEYHAGFDSGLKDKGNTIVNTEKMLSGIKSEYPLIQAYWQGYSDAYNGYMRNTVKYYKYKK